MSILLFKKIKNFSNGRKYGRIKAYNYINLKIKWLKIDFKGLLFG